MIKIQSDNFNIEHIAHSGQCFRIYERSPGLWETIAFGKSLKIRKNNANLHIFECNKNEYDEIWRDYFDMQRDYNKIKDTIRASGDSYLIKAANFGYGIRILKQDLWETIVSFIISQQNNISRIKKIIERLCLPYGSRFPSPNELAEFSENDLIKLGLGYRAKYVRNIAVSVAEGKFNFDKINRMTYEEAIAYLKQFNGIGAKVADCIALYGLGKLQAFPMDVWIKRILRQQYNGSFDISRFREYAGVVQQYMFYYERFH